MPVESLGWCAERGVKGEPNGTKQVFTGEMMALFASNKWVFNHSGRIFGQGLKRSIARVEIDADAILINCGVVIHPTSIPEFINSGEGM
jgi:hypothetical protein